MILCIHRVNTIEKLKTIPKEYGIEIDLRAHEKGAKKIILNHDPFDGGEDFETFLDYYDHRFIILNVKEAGFEDYARQLCEDRGIENYFLLDVEFPYMYRSTREGNRKISVRYSEDEAIEQTLKYKDKLDWCWVDTNTILPLDEKVVEQLKGIKTALVCPERWGRPNDIPLYIDQMKSLGFKPDMVMTAWDYVSQWESLG